MNDFTSAKIGLVRMRQVRVKKEKCDVPVNIIAGHFCGGKFDTSNEDKSEYCVGCPKSLTKDAWTYTEAKDIWGISIVGHYNTYSGGGYIQNLHNEKATTLAIVDELVEHFWIDRLTRAVFVEFTLYNANVNLLCYSIFLAEFLETGHGTNWVDTQCFRPSFLTDATGLFSVLFYCMFIVILLYRTKLLITNMKNQKCSFWKGFWNIIDAFICFLGYSGIAAWVGKFIYTKKALNLYFINKDVFINFQHIVIWEYIFSTILGCLVFISTLRVMSALEYNKRMTALADTLRHGGGAIFRFSVIVFIGLGAFAVLGYLLFGPAVYEYRNIFVTFGSLTNTLIGRNSLDSMIRAAPTFAEVYFFVYAFFVIFTLLTIFAAVLNDSISHVRQEQLQQPEPIGILNVMKNSIRDMFGLVGIHIKRTDCDNKDKRKEESIHENAVDTPNVLKLMRDVITLNLQEESQNNMSSKMDCFKSSMALSRQNIFLPYNPSRRTSRDKGSNGMTYVSGYDETDFEKECIPNTPSRDYMGFGSRDSLTPDESLRENTVTPQTGRATEPVCLPHDPYIGSAINSGYVATVYGMEYDDNFGSLYDKDVPCVVCRANHVTSKVILPGKITCHAGWRKEYSCMLVAGYHGHKDASSYFCIDQNSDVLEAGLANDNGYVFIL
ncbi:unnamed protein product [Mytilus coruscus]|uniref:Uncharacterized protein n=1 Tax=Mytilus coruscus TaxID=42192 RepID=A0A6J8DM04_MYTCO|nr:unnamed protein product [Mytilus coruscus]